MHLIKRHSFLIIAILIVIGLYLFFRSQEAVAPTNEVSVNSEDQELSNIENELEDKQILKMEECSAKNSQFAANECAFAAFDLAKNILEETYKKQYQEAETFFKTSEENIGRLKTLEESQQAWVIYRDKYCFYKSNAYKGGSIEGYEHARCLYELTQQRIEQLNMPY